MNAIKFATLTLACAAFSGGAMAQGSLDNPSFTEVGTLSDLSKAAGKALLTAKDIVAEDAAQGSALAPGQTAAPVLGTPKRDFFIRLDKLRAYQGGSVEGLLTDSKQVYYPVYVGNRPASTITLVQGKAGWEMTSVGETELTQRRQDAIGKSAKRFARKESDHFIVRIPSLSIEFSAFRNRSGDLQLASVVDNEKYGLTAGEAEDAKAVISRIVPHAREFKELQN
jgi:hypothetical protein